MQNVPRNPMVPLFFFFCTWSGTQGCARSWVNGNTTEVTPVFFRSAFHPPLVTISQVQSYHVCRDGIAGIIVPSKITSYRTSQTRRSLFRRAASGAPSSPHWGAVSWIQRPVSKPHSQFHYRVCITQDSYKVTAALPCTEWRATARRE